MSGEVFDRVEVRTIRSSTVSDFDRFKFQPIIIPNYDCFEFRTVFRISNLFFDRSRA